MLRPAYAELMRDAVTVYMAASPQQVWRLVSDITSIGRYSPETFEAEWLGDEATPVVGARFRGHVRRNGRWPVYWTTCIVTASDPGREFSFAVAARGGVVNTWRYRFRQQGAGTDVTESFELADRWFLRLYWSLFGRMRRRTNVTGMRRTLERIKAVVESPAA